MADRTPDHDLAWLCGQAASDLDQRGYAFAGVVRQAARRLVELAEQTRHLPVEHGCPGCGGEVVQPATGRRRTYCSERCRSRARRR